MNSLSRLTLSLRMALPAGLLLLPLVSSADDAATAAPVDTNGKKNDTIVVTAQDENNLPPLGRYQNTGTKSTLTAQETPQTINTVEAQELDERGINALNEALRYVAGVTTENRGGAITRFDEFTIRGFKNSENYLDGLQLPYNEWNIQGQVDTYMLNRIEIMKGPASVLYGNASPGGIVNLISKKPEESQNTDLEFNTSNQNRREGKIDSTGRIGDSDVTYRFVGLASARDGQAKTTHEERYLLAPSLRWDINENNSLLVQAFLQNDPNAGAYSSLPASGTLWGNPNGQLPSNAYVGDINWESYKRKQESVGYQFDHRFNDDWSFTQKTRFMHITAYQENTYSSNGGLDADQRTLQRHLYLTDESMDSFTIDNQVAGKFNTWMLEHNVLAGMDYQWQHNRTIYQDGLAPSIDIFNPDNNQIDRSQVTFLPGYATDARYKMHQTGYYLQDQINIDRLTLLAGGRYDTYEKRTYGLQYGADVNETFSQDKFTKRFGAMYHFDNGISPYVAYSEGFEPVAGRNKSGGSYKPETSKMWEGGVKFATPGQDTQFTASVFDIKKKNALTSNPAGADPYEKYQTGEVESKGYELELRTSPLENLLLTMNYAYTDVKVTEDANASLIGKRPVQTAKDNASAWANYTIDTTFLRGLTVGAGIRYIGRMEVDQQNSAQVPAVTLYDMAASYELGNLTPVLDDATLKVAVNNLTDKRYIASCYDSNNCWFGAERSVVVGVKYSF